MLVVQQYPPQRQPAFADAGPRLDLCPDSLLPRTVEVADRRLAEALGERIVRSGEA